MLKLPVAAALLSLWGAVALAEPPQTAICRNNKDGMYPCQRVFLPGDSKYSGMLALVNLANSDKPSFLLKIRKNCNGQYDVFARMKQNWVSLGVWRHKVYAADYICIEPFFQTMSPDFKEVCNYFN